VVCDRIGTVVQLVLRMLGACICVRDLILFCVIDTKVVFVYEFFGVFR
jgi:hypothetical protein